MLLVFPVYSQEDELTIYTITDEEFEEHIAPFLPDAPDPALIESMQIILDNYYDEMDDKRDDSVIVQSAFLSECQ